LFGEGGRLTMQFGPPRRNLLTEFALQ
jgi:hypothetical protein